MGCGSSVQPEASESVPTNRAPNRGDGEGGGEGGGGVVARGIWNMRDWFSGDPGRSVNHNLDDEDNEDLPQGDNINVEIYEPDKNDEDDPGKPEIEKKPLKVTSVDFHIEENTTDHKTAKFQIVETGDPRQLVVRRGSTVKVTLSLNRTFDKEMDGMKLIFKLGQGSRIGKGTMQIMELGEAPTQIHPWAWTSDIAATDKHAITLHILPHAKTMIGKWRFVVHSWKKTEDTGSRQFMKFTHTQPMCVLFNPWCQDDQVYMENEEVLEECLINDMGYMFQGNERWIGYKPWNFAQWDEEILDCSLYLLEKAGLLYSSRGDPAIVARTISALVNSNDNNGVLSGNWSGEYFGGTSPSKWSGSLKILMQYWKTKRPVKYGQCWVFSGVVTSVCRALGIPCRSVTNFSSAHDTDGSLTIDKYYLYNGDPDKYKTDDSIWNFHVWNETWMARPDLGNPYKEPGFQVIDATPQETSDGIFQAGPCPVSAIKQGDLFLNYDARFIYAEVNGDQVLYMARPDGSYRVVMKRAVVGKMISTSKSAKQIPDKVRRADDVREDITDTYKYAEGSAEERETQLRANIWSMNPEIMELYNQKGGLEVTVDDLTEIVIGNDFSFNVKVRSNANKSCNIEANLTMTSVFYTGINKSKVVSKVLLETLDANEEKTLTLQVKCEDYLRHIADQGLFRITAVVQDKASDAVAIIEDSFKFTLPDISIKGNEKVKTSEPFELEVEFENPLHVPLTGVTLDTDCPGFKFKMAKIEKTINSKSKLVTKVKFQSKRTRESKRNIIFTLSSNEIDDATGSILITVEE